MKRKVSLMAMALLLTMALGSVAAFAAGTSYAYPYLTATGSSANPHTGSIVAATSASGGSLYGNFHTGTNGAMVCSSLDGYTGTIQASFQINYGKTKSVGVSTTYGSVHKARGKISADPTISTCSGTVRVTVP